MTDRVTALLAMTDAQWAFAGVVVTAMTGLIVAAIERVRRENNRDHATTRDTILALRDDVAQVGEQLDRIDSRVERIDGRVDRLDSRLEHHLERAEGDNR